MIAYLKGLITYKSPTKIYIECAGVGYHVNISLQTYAKIEELKEAKVYAYTHINEQAHTLYGFADEMERDVFLLLISVNGVGPNTARLILSSLSPNELKKAIIYQEVSLIQKIKGIGPKTAQRMVLELKDKMEKIQTDDYSIDITSRPKALESDEAIAALVMLGFPKNHAEKVVQKVSKEHPSTSSVEELIKLSLKNL
ncbi:MAG: Holliday junction branch migration protein RuvA [Chitinophagales bacterium]|nr:Holliday junction branch migration protein RuvA [Chitinophagales bacterium]